MFEIRQANESDYPSMAELIRDFFKGYDSEIQPDIEFSTNLANKMAKNHIMLVLDIGGIVVGGIGGLVIPSLFNDKIKVFQEVFFYVERGFRKYSQLLLTELEKRCKQVGVDNIIMAHPDGKDIDKMKRFYKARGYNRLEVHFIRRLNK